jgi:hypothetical protein
MAEKIDYALTDAEALVLMTGTQEAVAEAASLVEASPGAAAAGGRAAVRLTRVFSAVSAVELPDDPTQVRSAAEAVIAVFGTVIADPNGAGDGSVWGLVASGAMNMTVALVRVDVEPLPSGGSRVTVRGSGREGLIKQRIGGKAADRIVARLAGS